MLRAGTRAFGFDRSHQDVQNLTSKPRLYAVIGFIQETSLPLIHPLDFHWSGAVHKGQDAVAPAMLVADVVLPGEEVAVLIYMVVAAPVIYGFVDEPR